jgi:hypothetical protein
MHDRQCRANYRVEPEQALTESTLQGFSLKLTLWLPERHVDDEVEFIEQHFRAANATEEWRLRWLLLLRLAASERPRMHCGVNQRMVVPPHTGDVYCVCRENRWCDDGGAWHSVFNVAGVAINAAVILLCVFAVLRIYNELQLIFSTPIPYTSSAQQRRPGGTA